MRADSHHAPAHPRPGGRSGGKRGGTRDDTRDDRHGDEGNGVPRADARVGALERLAGPVVRAAGMDMEEVQLTPVGRRRVLRVIVDAPGGAGLDDMALVSQALSAELDATGIMGETPYTLEVTSPGVDRPLTLPRHWQRSVGRVVKVQVTGPGQSPGRRPGRSPGRSHGAGGVGRDADGPDGRSGRGGKGSGEGIGEAIGEGSRERGVGRGARVVSGRVMAAGDDGVVLDIDGEQREFGFAELGPGKVQVEFRRDDMGESRGY